MTTKKPKYKRDRHGRISGGTVVVDTLEMFREVHRDEKIERELGSIARMVFIDRNAQGYPAEVRFDVKAKARQNLRAALRHAAKARTALMTGQSDLLYELEKTRAHLELQTAAVKFRQAYINAFRVNQSNRRRGHVQTKLGSPKAGTKSGTDHLDQYANVSQIVANLARRRDALGDWTPARELWPDVYSTLDLMRLEPEETADAITYDAVGGRTEIKFTSFKVMVSRYRKSKS